MESLLYTISGLPVHALIVHFAVVVLPVSAIGLIAIIYTPKLKGKYSFLAASGIVLGSASVLVAKQSGEALAEHIGTPVVHADYASLLTYAAFIFMVLTVLWYRSSKGRRSRIVTPISHVTAIAGVAVLFLTFLTGHTGAEAVWKGRLASTTPAATASPSATTPSKVTGTYNSADLKKHAIASSCWTAVHGSVYDLTKWAARHPGGKSSILSLCGRDGSAAFNGQHGGQSSPASQLANYKIGKFA
jgi:uncharacterized membrane protein